MRREKVQREWTRSAKRGRKKVKRKRNTRREIRKRAKFQEKRKYLE